MFVKLYNICNSPAALEGWKERSTTNLITSSGNVSFEGERRTKIMDDIVFCVVVLSFKQQKPIVRCKRHSISSKRRLHLKFEKNFADVVSEMICFNGLIVFFSHLCMKDRKK